jgi:hypothetical protein
MKIDTSNIDYTHAKEVYNRLMNKTDLLSEKQIELMVESTRIKLHTNLGLDTNNMRTRLNEIERQSLLIEEQLLNILKDIRFIRRMTELNLPVNFN